MTRTGLRKIALLLLAAVLFFPWAASAAPRPHRPRAVQASTATVLDLLGRAWGFLIATWDKEGCHIDPSGRCIPLKPEPMIQADTGCHLDPHGGCRE